MCRIVLELAEHVQEFVTSFDDSSSPVVCETSNHYSDSVYDTFVLELLQVNSLRTFMGVWQLMAAANEVWCKVFQYDKTGFPPKVNCNSLNERQPGTFATAIPGGENRREERTGKAKKELDGRCKGMVRVDKLWRYETEGRQQ
ncbi:hypothetical protein ElyMa_004861400 [Elysia marginata]|uniref:Uncharacterized protein n=1 Tax=Elysia marginata TaxID=1093978 RepID=A0AAV4ITB2_9GAST|nr:hypothetical protein ElyMa_004861400 [Elysia marginata]